MAAAKHIAGLDGLRFISISFVVLHHLFTFKHEFGFSAFNYPVIGMIGFYGIQFFFVGSGFLITYLLLAEQQRFGRISLKHFFVRRILRIWPGYYLLVILSIFVTLYVPALNIPGYTTEYLQTAGKANTLYLLFLPHVEPFLYPTAPYIHHTYTIGIEEQFYILWGLLFYFARRYLITVFVAILFAMPVLNFLHELSFAYVKTHSAPSVFLLWFNKGVTFLKFSRFSTFAIGSIFGYAYFHQSQWIDYFKTPVTQILIYVLIISSIAFNVQVPHMEYEYISVLMACLMLMASYKNTSLVNYDAKWLSALGKVSYGIYLFHIFAIVFAVKVISFVSLDKSSFFTMILLCVATLTLSVFFGWLSYHYFEKIFLRLKRRFRKV